jgi:hypothetical protein
VVKEGLYKIAGNLKKKKKVNREIERIVKGNKKSIK